MQIQLNRSESSWKFSYFARKRQSWLVASRKVLAHRSASAVKIRTCCQPSDVSCGPSNDRKDSGNAPKMSAQDETRFGRRNDLLIHISTINRIGNRHHQPKSGYVARERELIIQK